MAKCACVGRVVVQNGKVKMLWSKGLDHGPKWSRGVSQALCPLGMRVFQAWDPPCETQTCAPHNHTLRPFPLLQDRYCSQKLTSLSTGVKSDFWLLRSAFKCRILFFDFAFGAIMTWMFGNSKETKLAKNLSWNFPNRVYWDYEPFKVEIGAKMND